MKSIVFSLSCVFLALATASCGKTRELGDVESLVTPTLVIDFGHQESRAACQFSKDCVLMRVGVCGNVQAIHFSQVDTAKAYTQQEKLKHPLVQCSPQLPIETYQSLCLNQKCRAVVRDYDLILEVLEQPIAGQPFWVGMRFQYHESLELLEARFLLPDSVEVVSGLESWSGPVEEGRNYVLWVEVQTNKVGDLYLTGWTGIKKGDPNIPALSWSDHIEVSSPYSLTPWPERERILPTPTPTP